MTEPLHVWAIFWSPGDAPGQFVVRRFEVGLGEVRPTLDARYSTRLEPLRDLMRARGLHCLPRMPGDHPSVVESWI